MYLDSSPPLFPAPPCPSSDPHWLLILVPSCLIQLWQLFVNKSILSSIVHHGCHLLYCGVCGLDVVVVICGGGNVLECKNFISKVKIMTKKILVGLNVLMLFGLYVT